MLGGKHPLPWELHSQTRLIPARGETELTLSSVGRFYWIIPSNAGELRRLCCQMSQLRFIPRSWGKRWEWPQRSWVVRSNGSSPARVRKRRIRAFQASRSGFIPRSWGKRKTITFNRGSSRIIPARAWGKPFVFRAQHLGSGLIPASAGKKFLGKAPEALHLGASPTCVREACLSGLAFPGGLDHPREHGEGALAFISE